MRSHVTPENIYRPWRRPSRGLACLAAGLLVACGGGGDETSAPTSQSSALIGGTAGGSLATPALVGPSDHRRAMICGFEVAPNVLRGTVLRVHDGDTITLSNSPADLAIRLEGIDAPELMQIHGVAARDALTAAVLGRSVLVAHQANDAYGRVIGSVFTEDCVYANARQLETGHAWFYRAYQCELALSLRLSFQALEAQARTARLGLWVDAAPVAPWVHRNGVDPAVPTCAGDMAALGGIGAMIGSGLPTAGPGSLAGDESGSVVSAGSSSSGGTSTATPPSSSVGATSGSCGPKTTCTQMSSCAEAKTYLACGLRSLDGDGDGTPCETLCKG